MKTFIPNGGQLEDHKSVEESRLSRRKLLLGGGGIAGGLMLARRADAAPDPARETINDDSNRRPPRLLVADLRGPQGPDMRRGPGANPAAPQSIVVQPGSGENVATPYPFNGKHLSGFLVSNLYSFDTGTLFSARDISSIILTNLGSQPVFVSADADDDKSPAVASPLKHTVQPLQSAIVRSGVQISTAYASADGLVSLVHVREPKITRRTFSLRRIPGRATDTRRDFRPFRCGFQVNCSSTTSSRSTLGKWQASHLLLEVSLSVTTFTQIFGGCRPGPMQVSTMSITTIFWRSTHNSWGLVACKNSGT